MSFEMKNLLYIIYGIIFGLVINHLGYLMSYDYTDHIGKIFLIMIGLWLLIATSLVYYHRKISLNPLTARFFIWMFFLIQMGGITGMALHNFLFIDIKLQRQEEYLRNLLTVDNSSTLSLSAIYDSQKDELSYNIIDLLTGGVALAAFFLILSIIPILLVKVKRKSHNYVTEI